MLQTFKTTSKFKTEVFLYNYKFKVMRVLVSHLNEHEINELKNAFIVIDKDKSGVIKLH